MILLINLNKKVTSNKTKHVIVQNDLSELLKKSSRNINKRNNKRFDK